MAFNKTKDQEVAALLKKANAPRSTNPFDYAIASQQPAITNATVDYSDDDEDVYAASVVPVSPRAPPPAASSLTSARPSRPRAMLQMHRLLPVEGVPVVASRKARRT